MKTCLVLKVKWIGTSEIGIKRCRKETTRATRQILAPSTTLEASLSGWGNFSLCWKRRDWLLDIVAAMTSGIYLAGPPPLSTLSRLPDSDLTLQVRSGASLSHPNTRYLQVPPNGTGAIQILSTSPSFDVAVASVHEGSPQQAIIATQARPSFRS